MQDGAWEREREREAESNWLNRALTQACSKGFTISDVGFFLVAFFFSRIPLGEVVLFFLCFVVCFFFDLFFLFCSFFVVFHVISFKFC